MHFRLEIGRWWLQIGKSDPEPPDATEAPGVVVDHPSPQVVYPPERVGFYRLPDEND